MALNPTDPNQDDWSDDEVQIQNLEDWLLQVREQPLSVYELKKRIERGLIIQNPDFQRNEVWSNKQRSQLIESILLNFPLPALYLNEDRNGKLIIIDGKQRISSLVKFLDVEFSLTELSILRQYQGKTFDELPVIAQNKLQDAKLNLYILNYGTSMPIVYELFNRLNTGGTPLNRQEVRHCLFSGQGTVLLKTLAESPKFKAAFDHSLNPLRMKDRETILRFLSFYILGYESYQGNLSNFLELGLKQLNQASEAEIQAWTHRFETVMELSLELFGKDNFRLPLIDEEQNYQSRGFINLAVFDSLAVFIAKKDTAFLRRNAEQIKKNFLELSCKHKDYREAVQSSTANQAKLRLRFELVEKVLIQNTI